MEIKEFIEKGYAVIEDVRVIQEFKLDFTGLVEEDIEDFEEGETPGGRLLDEYSMDEESTFAIYEPRGTDENCIVQGINRFELVEFIKNEM